MLNTIATRPVRAAAGFWGLVVFLPVGMNYLAFVLLLLALLVERLRGRDPTLEAPARWARVRQHPMWWPAVALLAWTLAVLALRPFHPDTALNLAHELRVIATLLLALALTREEVMWALGGVLAALTVSLAVIGFHLSVGISAPGPWTDLIVIRGNKSIADSLLFALLGVAALVAAASSRGWRRAAGVVLGVCALAVLITVLPLRTAMVVAALGLVAACWHGFRTEGRWLLASLAACVLAIAAIAAAVPQVPERFVQGVNDVREARAGGAWNTSWGVRWHMAAVTARMIAERPLLGWGVGSWREQWRVRVPAEWAEYNMPHNDYLWMGAQAGVPGGALYLALVLAALPAAWRRRDLAGRLALTATLALALAGATNSATRDATMGLSLLWVVGLFLRLAAEPAGRPECGPTAGPAALDDPVHVPEAPGAG